MSNISRYPRVPVRTRSLAEGTRRSSEAINFILRTINHLLNVSEERGYFSGLTSPDDVLSDAPVINWDMAGEHSSSNTELQIDAASGEVTIASRGIYHVEANFIGVGTGSNTMHSIVVDRDVGGIGSWTLAAAVINTVNRSNQTVEVGLTGFVFMLLESGDKVRFAHASSSGTDTLTVTTAQAGITLRNDDHV